MKNTLILAICIFILTGCASVGQVASSGEEHIGPYPENWRTIVRNYIKSSYVDPYSVRDSEAAAPFRNKALFFDSWDICIRNNAKNRMGGYTGLTTSVISVQKGEVVAVDNSDFHCRGRNLKWESLPLPN